MTGAMTAFAVAVGSTSLVCYLLMTRLPNRGVKRGSSRHSPASDGGNYAGGDYAGGWTVAGWFGSDHSGLDSSGNPSDAGGGDSGGGDGGGGGGGD
jgi:hypothetical protein